jgi:hypothetical protein
VCTTLLCRGNIFNLRSEYTVTVEVMCELEHPKTKLVDFYSWSEASRHTNKKQALCGLLTAIATNKMFNVAVSSFPNFIFINIYEWT